MKGWREEKERSLIVIMHNRKDWEKKEKEDCSHSDWLNETSSIFCNVIRPNINLPQTILVIKYNSSFLLISYLWENVSDILGSVKSDEKSRWIKVMSLGDELKRWAEMMNWSDKFRRWIEAMNWADTFRFIFSQSSTP
jgi:hypothetical protein